jgi:hypothetical protein
MFCWKARLGKATLAKMKTAWWRSARLRQLGKSSQPLETKWADLARAGK